jgi:hypothetical protein
MIMMFYLQALLIKGFRRSSVSGCMMNNAGLVLQWDMAYIMSLEDYIILDVPTVNCLCVLMSMVK